MALSADAADPARPPRFAAAAPYLLFLAITLIVFGPALVRGDYPARPDVLSRAWPWRSAPEGASDRAPVGMSDPVTYFLPANRFYADAIRRGEMPFWNPHLMCGYPALASGQIGAFYPPKWILCRLLDLPRAMTLLLALHFWGAGAAMAYLLRTRGAGPFGAAVAGLTWMLCEANAFFLQFDALTIANVWLPLTVAWAGRAFDRRSIRWALAAGLAFGLGLLGAYLQRMYYAGLVVAAWAAARGIGGMRRETESRVRAALVPAVLAAVTLAVGAAVGAAALAPFWELQRDPVRAAVPYADLFPSFWRRAAGLVTLVAPRLLGGDLDPLDLWGKAASTFREFTAYVGILPLALGIGALAGPRRREGILFAATAAAALLLVLGTPLARAAYALLPGFDRAEPTRLFWLWGFGLAGLAGLGADALATAPAAPAWRRLERLLGTGALLLGLAGVGCCVARRAGVGATPIRWGDIANPAIATGVLGLAAAAAVVAAARRGGPPRAIPAGACAVVALDLLLLLLPMNPASAPARLYPETPALSRLQEEARRGAPFRTIARRALLWWDWRTTNALLPYGLDTPEGHEAIRPAAYSRFVREAGGRGRPGPADVRAVDFRTFDVSPRLLDFVNVRYVMADPGEALPLPGWRTIPMPDATLYENPSPLPRAFLVPRAEVIPDEARALARLAAPAFHFREAVVLTGGPDAVRDAPLTGGTAAFSRPAPDAAVVEAHTDGAGFVVMSETWDEGWVARRNGEPCPVLRADHAFRAVEIPRAGTWRIEMEYRPRWWPWALYVSLAGMGAGLLGWALTGQRKNTDS